MLARRLLLPFPQSRISFACLACTARSSFYPPPHRPFSATPDLAASKGTRRRKNKSKKLAKELTKELAQNGGHGANDNVESGTKTAETLETAPGVDDISPQQSAESAATILTQPENKSATKRKRAKGTKTTEKANKQTTKKATKKSTTKPNKKSAEKPNKKSAEKPNKESTEKTTKKTTKSAENELTTEKAAAGSEPKLMSLKEALLASAKERRWKHRADAEAVEPLEINILEPVDLDFKPVDVEIPPVPRLAYGLDRVLFNPGVYRLQDPTSRVYNFDPYLEKILPVQEFDFGALSEYKTSSKDEELLALNRRLGTKFTGSTSSMSGILQHFHFLLSDFRKLNHNMLSRGFPEPNRTFSKITLGPSAIFLRYQDGRYAIDADKSYDEPNIMSWLGHSLEKLLTTDRADFERYRRSNTGQAPKEDSSSRCYHYSTLGNFLMRSQLDAHDARLPGSGIFDLKTRAVISIRMDHKEYEVGSGYQLRYARGEWESFEREFYDMTRATLLKYSLQVRMGRMNGIFIAYHNIERIFGFQYLALSDMDEVLHGQSDPSLGDQEFRASISLLDELLQKATAKFPETSLRLHFYAQDKKIPFMYIFAEPVTEEQADEIQSARQAEQRAFAREIVGMDRNDPEVQKEWHEIQERVNDEMRNLVDDDEEADALNKNPRSEEGAIEKDQEDMVEDDRDVGQATEKERGVALTEDGDVAADTDATQASVASTAAEATTPPTGPLMGWTLTIRNRVNGVYVSRPEQLSSEDVWKVEYHIKEIEPDARWDLYTNVKMTREKRLGEKDEIRDERLRPYRGIIHSYSKRGRAWREQQDEVESGMEKQVFRPMGPGAAAVGHDG